MSNSIFTGVLLVSFSKNKKLPEEIYAVYIRNQAVAINMWKYRITVIHVQGTVKLTNDSNTDGSLIVADMNWFLSPKEILPIALFKYAENFTTKK